MAINSRPKRKWWGVLPALLASGASLAGDDRPAVSLERNTPVSAEVSGAAVHQYRLILAAGECANLVVEQRGIDAVVQVQDLDGKPIFEIDSERRPQGKESVTVVAGRAGVYPLTVRARYPEEPPGVYEIRILDVRPATGPDRSL